MRVFALAGAIGIEPTQWESEAQVLPLHQAPSLKALYNILKHFANTFCKYKKQIINTLTFFLYIDNIFNVDLTIYGV